MEGRWEARLPSLSGYKREVMVFRDGIFYDSIYYAVDPPMAWEPKPYRVIDDSTVALGDDVDAGQGTLRYRIRKGNLVILQGFRPDMFRTPPDIP